MSGKPQILLLGAGGHARACIDVIEQEDRFVIVGLIGFDHEVGSTVLGYPIVGTDADLPRLASTIRFGVVTIGQIKTPQPRIAAFHLAERYGMMTPVIVSPRAHVSRHASVGGGTIVLHGAVVNAGAAVGRNCIINSQSLVEHDAQIGDHCHISTKATVNGGVHIGEGTFIGSGTVIRQDITIGQLCVIGMAQRVLADCDAGTLIPQFKS